VVALPGVSGGIEAWEGGVMGSAPLQVLEEARARLADVEARGVAGFGYVPGEYTAVLAEVRAAEAAVEAARDPLGFGRSGRRQAELLARVTGRSDAERVAEQKPAGPGRGSFEGGARGGFVSAKPDMDGWLRSRARHGYGSVTIDGGLL